MLLCFFFLELSVGDSFLLLLLPFRLSELGFLHCSLFLSLLPPVTSPLCEMKRKKEREDGEKVINCGRQMGGKYVLREEDLR